MATVGLPIVVLLIIVMIFGSNAMAGHSHNDASMDLKYANKPIVHRKHTFYMEIKGEVLDNENAIENDKNTPEENEGAIKELKGSKSSESEVDMPDIYLVSETKALKVSRSRGDMLKSCKPVDLNAATMDDAITQVAVDDSMMDGMAMLCDVSRLHSDSDNNQLPRPIYPGTQWCGLGNNANNYSDLGSLKLVDACCRAHDNCNISIDGFEYKYGLFLFGIWGRKSCACDREFYQCLKNIPRNETADAENGDIIGNIFFDVLNIGCIQEDYPVKCVQRSWWGICIQFEPDTSRSKRMVFKRDDLFY